MRSGHPFPSLSWYTSLFLLLTFTFQTVSTSSIYAAVAGGVEDHDSHSHQAGRPDLAHLNLPRELGTIERIHQADPNRTVVLIQDAHAIGAAQTSIQRILQYLIEQQSVSFVALEGASKSFDPFFLKSFPDTHKRAEVLERYVGAGEVSGAIGAAVLNSGKAEFTGIENQDLYEQGIDLFLTSLQQKENALNQLKPLHEKIAQRKKEIYSKELLALDQIEKDFEGSETAAALKELFRNEEVDSVRFPHLAAFQKELGARQPNSLENKNALLSFFQKLSAKVKDHRIWSPISAKKQEYLTEQISESDFASSMIQAANSAGIDVPENIQGLAAAFQQIQTMRGEIFYEECQEYFRFLRAAKIKNTNQKTLAAHSRFADLLEKLIQLKLSRKEWREIQSPNAADAELKKLAKVLLAEESVYVRFYHNAESREHALYENLNRAMKKSPRAAMITGGFHTTGFLEKLEQEQVSYILISPAIASLKGEENYANRMQGQVSWKNYFEIKDGRINLAEAFSRSVRDELIKASGPETLKVWRDNIIRGLADEKRLTEAANYTRYIDEKTAEQNKTLSGEAWSKRIERFISDLTLLRNQNQLTVGNLQRIVSASGIPDGFSVPGTIPASWASGQPSTVSEPELIVRSESRGKAIDYAGLKGLNRLQNATVISLQMEMGYSNGFLKAVEAAYGKQAADQVSQASLTGGLGALMHDLFPSWKANGLDIIGIHPIWDEIKKKPYPEGPLHLGKFQRDVMQSQMAARGEKTIKFTVDLPWDDAYKNYAQGNEKARNAFGRKIHYEVFIERTSQYDAPQYHLYAYYLKDEKGNDVEENQIAIFDTVYSDDHPAWRDLHMAIYSRGAEELIQELKKRGVIKQQTAEIHNEVFVSLPKAKSDPNRIMIHINHSAYQPTIYSPSVNSFGLFGFQPWMKPHIVKDNGKFINLVDYAALAYDMLTGVAIDEHYAVLRRNIFRNAGSRLDFYNDGRIRSTNGVLTEHWQSAALQALIENYRIQLELPETVDSADFYKALEENTVLREEFITRQELIKAADVVRFLSWMADVQNQPAWLDKALNESGLTRKDLSVFAAAVLEAAQKHDTAEWKTISKQYAGLKDLLLSRPMSSNVRRQVPYKGPEKWSELLEELKNSPEKLAKFKESKVRQIIGGRTFSADADRDFQNMKQLVKTLGLEDHFAFIENYNVYDAAYMFQAMAGVVMLSDEFLEASATSMMKGVVNGAALIGVWGGAMPELFKIVDEQSQSVNIFEKKTPHNLVLKNLKNGKWKLVNGYMVRYTAELSRQAGGGRRPDAQALLNSLFWLNDQYADPAKRRELLWQSVSGTSKVDMREGQARAHMHLIEKALAEREQRSRLFEGLVFSQSDAEKILDPSAEKFIWRRNGQQLLKTSEATSPGILGLVESFRQISTYGAGDERGMAAVEAIRHHAMNGDIFNYIFGQLDHVSSTPNLTPLIDELKKLSAEAKDLPKRLNQIKADPEMEDEYRKGLEKLSNLNIQAIELLEHLGLWLAEKSIEVYFSEQEPENFSQRVLSSLLLRKYLARYLEGHPEVFTLETQNSLIKAFGLIRNGEPYVFAVNIGSPVTYGMGNKARGGDIIHSTALDRFLSQFIPDYEIHVLQKQAYGVQMVNAKNDEKYRYYNLTNPATKISLGIPEPEGVQLLRLEHREGPVATLMVSSDREQDGQPIIDFVTQIQSQALASDIERADSSRGVLAVSEKIDQQKMDELLRPLTELTPEDAARQFGRYLPTVMALIAGLSPRHLDLLQSWDAVTYAALKKIQTDNKQLFEEGEITFHGTNLHTSIVFSRSINAGAAGENIVFALQFSEGPVNHQDGKVWSRVRRLGDEKHPLKLMPQNEYEVRNLLGDVTYSRIRTGAELLAGWDIGIPVEDRYDRSEKIRHEWGFDVYQIRSVTPRFDLSAAPAQAQAAVHPATELMLSLNLPDVGAEYDPKTGTVQTYGALEKIAQLVPAISAAGIGRVYLVGLYEKGKISSQLHNLPHDGIHFIGDSEGLPRVMVSINHYKTKQRGNLRDNHGNIFSPISMLKIEPRHSATPSQPGTSEASEKLLRDGVALLNQSGIESIADFIFWRAPESINETNYKQYFYRELNAEEQEDWNELTSDEEKAKFMRQMVRDGGQFAVRIRENGKERLILVRYMYNEPGHDQAVRNIFHPEVMAQSKQELEALIDLGFSGIRIDLAHKLLNSELKGMYETWKDWNGEGYDPAREPLKELIDHARQYAASKNQSFYVVGESYMPYHHDALRHLGFDAVYYENFHKDYFRLASGDSAISAQHFGEVISHAAHNKHLLAFPSNFDVAPLKQANGQREAFLLALVILARAGAPVMIDAREMMDQSGHLIPVPGSEHPFPDDDDIQRRRDFDRYRWQFEQSPFLQLTERFLNLLDGRKLTGLKVLDNENRQQFIALDLQFEEGRGKTKKTDHMLIVLNMKPYDDQTIWSNWAHPHQQLVDVISGESFQVSGEKVGGIVFPSNIQYRILAPSTSSIVKSKTNKRSEVREIVAPVVTALKGETPLSPSAARLFVDIANADLPRVTGFVRQVAAQSNMNDFESFYAVHPDYEQRLDQAITDLNAQSIADARTYLTSHADGQMNYAAAFSIESITPQNKSRVLQSIQSYIQTVREIQQMARMDFPNAKVDGNIQVLMTAAQAKDPAFKDFRKAVDASGIAQRLVAGEAGSLMSLERFLNENENALIYGVTDASSWIQNQALSIRVVDSEMPVDAILPAGLILSNRLAVDSFKVTGETIKQIPDYLPGIIVWNGTELQITSGVLDLVYQDYLAHSYVSIMA